MGDILHALPAAASLKHSFPDLPLTWAVEAQWAPLLAGNPFIDRLVTIDRKHPGTWLRTRKTLCEQRFSLAIDFQGLLKSAFVAGLARPDRIAGSIDISAGTGGFPVLFARGAKPVDPLRWIGIWTWPRPPALPGCCACSPGDASQEEICRQIALAVASPEGTGAATGKRRRPRPSPDSDPPHGSTGFAPRANRTGKPPVPHLISMETGDAIRPGEAGDEGRLQQALKVDASENRCSHSVFRVRSQVPGCFRSMVTSRSMNGLPRAAAPIAPPRPGQRQVREAVLQRSRGRQRMEDIPIAPRRTTRSPLGCLERLDMFNQTGCSLGVFQLPVNDINWF